MDRLCNESKALAVFERAEGAKGYLDPLFVAPTDVEVHGPYELFNGCGLPIVRRGQFGLQTAEEAFARCVVRRVPFVRHRANQSCISHACKPPWPAIVNMFRTLLKSKIHRATVADCELHCEGSCAIDEDLLDAANLVENEQVHI